MIFVYYFFTSDMHIFINQLYWTKKDVQNIFDTSNIL
jgi:hypothetical protein